MFLEFLPYQINSSSYSSSSLEEQYSVITMLFLIISVLSAFTEFDHFERGIEENCNKLEKIVTNIKNLDKTQGNTICPSSPNFDFVPERMDGEWHTCHSKLNGKGSKQKDFDEAFSIYRYLNLYIKTVLHDAVADLNCSQCGTRFTKWQLHGIPKMTFDQLIQSYYTNQRRVEQQSDAAKDFVHQKIHNPESVDLKNAEFRGDRANPGLESNLQNELKTCMVCMKRSLTETEQNVITTAGVFLVFLLMMCFVVCNQ
mgnify:CR=1 FL=1